jgi:Flp pilus assembly protein TadG
MTRKPFHPTAPKGAPGLIGDRRGTAAVEFAFLFPVMLALFFGSFEITNLLMVNLKLTAATEAAADLLAQTRSNNNNVATSDLANYATAATMEMTPYAAAPYTTTGLQLAFAGITFNRNNGPAQIAWHNEQNSATPISIASLQGVLMSLNNNSGTDSVIVVQSQITYSSPLSFVLGKTYVVTDTAYNRPRYVLQITCTTC